MLTDRQIKLIIGSLLHDIGKVVYRTGDGRNHSQSGYTYLKEEAGIEDTDILNCVRYHHGVYLKDADLPVNDSVYLTYYADNVAAFSDRREVQEGESGFDKTMPLDSVFNILNGNRGKSHYAMQVLNLESPINYPTDESTVMDKQFYQTVINNITDNLKGLKWDEEYVNSILSVLEANLSYIPSSTSKRELADISLYDHLKMTAAIASCVEQYMNFQEEEDYKKCLLENAKQSYEEDMFLLFSMDISGIQKFIYTVGEKGALKGLRARSFYLEIIMEHMIDELLSGLSLSRANLIYSGGGHCYILVANTKEAVQYIKSYEKSLNKWLAERFDIALYVACGYCPASANALRNIPEESYAKLYLNVSKIISQKKSRRYSVEDILYFNQKKHDGERECKVCRRMGYLKEDKCSMCRALEKMSGSILYEKYFTVVTKEENDALPLPFGKYLVADTEGSLKMRMAGEEYVRCYTKNSLFTGKYVTTKLWVGDYTTGDTFETFAKQAEGIERIGVLRADVDNLGQTFIYGFQQSDGDDSYVTLSRTATLSRQLALFFKCYINQLLKAENRKVTIVYSGGDDLFLVGAWNEVLYAFVDLEKALQKFTQGTLTISGGIGIYPPKYPLNVMAREVEELENVSKHTDGKNAITIFDNTHNYPWYIFNQKVLGEKLETIRTYFQQSQERGMSFLYHLVELLRNSGKEINFARYVYLLSRMEPAEDCEIRERKAYKCFSKKMYEWSQSVEERRELLTAIYLYVYLQRGKEEGEQ